MKVFSSFGAFQLNIGLQFMESGSLERLLSASVELHSTQKKQRKSKEYRMTTRPSVNYAKDWVDQLFVFLGHVWSGKGFHLGCDHEGAVNN